MKLLCSSPDLFQSYQINGIVEASIIRKSLEEPDDITVRIAANVEERPMRYTELSTSCGLFRIERHGNKYVLLQDGPDGPTEDIALSLSIPRPVRPADLMSFMVEALEITELPKPMGGAIFLWEHFTCYLGMPHDEAHIAESELKKYLNENDLSRPYRRAQYVQEAIKQYIPTSKRTAGMQLFTTLSLKEMKHYETDYLLLLPTIADMQSATRFLEVTKNNSKLASMLSRALRVSVPEYPAYCFVTGITNLINILAMANEIGLRLDGLEDMAKHVWSGELCLRYLNAMAL